MKQKRKKDKSFLHIICENLMRIISIAEVIGLIIGIFFQVCGFGLLRYIQQKWPNRIEGGRIADYCNFVITFATITTAVMVFSYSVLDNNRMGVSNRTVIRYRFGNKLFPACFIISLLRLPVMKILLYIDLKYILCIELLLSSLSQIVIITFVVLSNNMEWVIQSIAENEKKQYIKLFKLQADELKQITPWENPHVQRAMKSTELFSDKANLLDAVFLIPFNVEGSDKETTELKTILDIDMNILYIFYYQNAFGAFSAFSENQDERQRLYTLFYVEIKKLIQETSQYDKKKDPEMEYKVSLAISAILNAALMSRVLEGEAFCIHVLKDVCALLNAELQKQQIIHYFLMLELMNMIDNGKVPIKYLNQLSYVLRHDSGRWLNVFCHSYWNIIVKNCTVNKDDNEVYFWNAVLTLRKKEQSSMLMSYIVQMEE